MQLMDYSYVNGLRILARIIARRHIKGQLDKYSENLKHMSVDFASGDVPDESLYEKIKDEMKDKENECGDD